MAGGNGVAACPRRTQLPIGLTPLTGRVGSLDAGPVGSVPAGNIFPLTINTPLRSGGLAGAKVRQSHATSKLTAFGSWAFTTAGTAKTTSPPRPARAKTTDAI